MNVKRALASAVCIAISFCLFCGRSPAQVKNGGFEETVEMSEDDEFIQSQLRLDWSFDEPILWPVGWEPNPFYGATKDVLKISQENPHTGKNCLYLGKKPHGAGWALAQTIPIEKGYYRVSFWARGEGLAGICIDNSFLIVRSTQVTSQWCKYEGSLKNRKGHMKQISPILGGVKPGVYFDDIACEKCTVVEAEIVDESNRMKQEGLWLSEDAAIAPEDFKALHATLAKTAGELENYLEADPRPERVELISQMKKRIEELAKIEAPPADTMNETRALAGIAKRLEEEMKFKEAAE